MKHWSTIILSRLLVAFVCWAVFVTACSKRETTLTTGKVIEGTTLPGFKGDAVYTEVRADSLPELYDNSRMVLNKLGLVKWDSRFDCNHIADLYVAAAQAQFAAAAWNSDTKAQTLALAVVWYSRDAGGAHAIVEARTDRGALFVDPTAGSAPVTLSAAEQRSIYFRKW